MINAGKYRHRITIFQTTTVEDESGFQHEETIPILTPYAYVKTTRGMTIIRNDSDFEKAYTNFTIRFPKTEITREMFVGFRGSVYTIEYLKNIDEASVELEMQCKLVEH